MSDNSPGPPDAEIVKLAQAGNSEAFSHLYEYYSLFIYRYLAGLVGDLEYAYDLTQETFIRAWINLPRLHDPSLFKSWLFPIARNLAIDHKRSTRKEAYRISWEDLEERHNVGPSCPGPEDTVVVEDLVRSILSKLPQNYRDCLLLQQAGFSHREIADLIGLTKESVGTYICNARKLFLKIYGQFDH